MIRKKTMIQNSLRYISNNTNYDHPVITPVTISELTHGKLNRSKEGINVICEDIEANILCNSVEAYKAHMPRKAKGMKARYLYNVGGQPGIKLIFDLNVDAVHSFANDSDLIDRLTGFFETAYYYSIEQFFHPISFTFGENQDGSPVHIVTTSFNTYSGPSRIRKNNAFFNVNTGDSDNDDSPLNRKDIAIEELLIWIKQGNHKKAKNDCTENDFKMIPW